jgi:hypothetical protein
MKMTKAVLLMENKLEELLRDKRVLNLVSKNINNAIKLQHFANKRIAFILKVADIATHKGLNELFESVNQLEKESKIHKERIAFLEDCLKNQEKTNSQKKIKPKRASLSIAD